MNIVHREDQQQREHVFLSPDAAFSDETEGRAQSAQPDFLRTEYQRDRDKILHSKSFRRLSHKTQVFLAAEGDHFRTRLTHTLEVAQIARTIARALGLNEDLTEAISLGHDLGHTPFGHAGERYLNQAFNRRCGRWFFHNVQSVRVLDVLGGRNVSLQVLDGTLCHNGEFEQQVFETSGLAEFDTFDRVVDSCWRSGEQAIAHLRPMTLEGCVVRVSDIIAYVGKDRQDAIRAGLLPEDAFDDGLGGAYNAWALKAFVADVVESSAGKDHIEMSPAGFAELRRAKRENYQKIYGSTEVDGDFGREVAELFDALYDHELAALRAGDEKSAIIAQHVRPTERRLSYYGRTYDWEDDPDQTVVDFISSMTDDYFMATCEALFPSAARVFPRRGYFSADVRP